MDEKVFLDGLVLFPLDLSGKNYLEEENFYFEENPEDAFFTTDSNNVLERIRKVSVP